jgi:hypothetical protein
MWYQAGQPADAKDALARFEEQASDSSTAWLIASDLWCSLGEFERATAACQRALSLGIAPPKQLADARFRLARLKMLADEYPRRFDY